MMKLNYKSKVFQLVYCLTLFIFIGCASIVDGGLAKVNVSSTPKSNFKVIDISNNNTVFSADTPASFDLKTSVGYFKAGRYDFVFNADEYKETTIRLEARLNTGWYIFGNLVFGGLIGWLVVDPITGAMYTFENENNVVVNASLLPSDNSSHERLESWDLKVVLINDPRINDLKDHLIKIN